MATDLLRGLRGLRSAESLQWKDNSSCLVSNHQNSGVGDTNFQTDPGQDKAMGN